MTNVIEIEGLEKSYRSRRGRTVAVDGLDLSVPEVGLLGRYDATNVIDADVAVVTNIGKDHTDGTEGWPEKVAAEKAGIIKPDSRVVLGSPMGDLLPIFEREPSAGV